MINSISSHSLPYKKESKEFEKMALTSLVGFLTENLSGMGGGFFQALGQPILNKHIAEGMAAKDETGIAASVQQTLWQIQEANNGESHQAHKKFKVTGEGIDEKFSTK